MANYTFRTTDGYGRQYSPQGYGTTIAAGGQRTYQAVRSGIPTNPKPADTLFGGYATQLTNRLGSAAQAFGDQAGVGLKQQIGDLLGNLNSIGALRSGAVQQGVNTFANLYGKQIGDSAAQNTLGALGLAQTENDLNIERSFRQQQYDDAKKAQRKAGIGSFLGTLGGLIPGVGGVIGSAAGGLLGDLFG